nr:helix-turn-helix transcriptional regulator [Anaerotignum propionicum]
MTERQKEVLDLVVQGMTNEEIGDTIGMSAGRARNIVAELISKFMVKNRTQLAVMAATTQMSPDRK